MSEENGNDQGFAVHDRRRVGRDVEDPYDRPGEVEAVPRVSGGAIQSSPEATGNQLVGGDGGGADPRVSQEDPQVGRKEAKPATYTCGTAFKCAHCGSVAFSPDQGMLKAALSGAVIKFPHECGGLNILRPEAPPILKPDGNLLNRQGRRAAGSQIRKTLGKR